MSGCEPTDEVRRIIRAMARAKVEEGFTDANAIVDEIHAAIQDHTPLWKNEIADIITGIGQPKRAATKSELQQRIEQLRRDLKATYHPKPAPKSPEEARNARRQTQLKKQIEELQAQLKAGEFSKEKREPFVYDRATQNLAADLASAKKEADRLLAKLEYQNKSPAAKMADTLFALYRASILSGYTVFEHLSGAVLWRILSHPIEQVAGALIHHTPGLKAISENAPTEGGGLQAQATWEGMKKVISKETARDILDKLRRGYSDKQALFGDVYDSNHPILDFVGHLHDAIKTPAENFGFYRALTTINSQMRASMARAGKTPEQIDAELADPYTQARNGALAYGEAKRAKLQGENKVVDLVRGVIRQVGQMGVGGKAVAGLANYQMPILKIPTNLVGETTSYAFGGLKALGAMMNHRREQFTPEVNDYILRNLKKGAIGAALGVLAWILGPQLGALYDEKRRKRAGEPDYGDLKTEWGTISHHFLHSPVWEYMQGVALARRVYEQEHGRVDKQTGEKKGAGEAAADAALRASIAVGESLPFVQAPEQFAKAIKSSHGVGDYAGKVASNLTTPQLVKQAAKATDPEKIPRAPFGFTQQLMVGIPGLREQVPLKKLKGMPLDQKLDLYDEMTPAQRKASGIGASILQSARGKRNTLTDDQIKRIEAIQ